MRNCPLLVISLASLLLAACGGKEEPPLVVNEKKFEEIHPQTDESGDVTVGPVDLSVKLQAPTPAWSVKIESVWVVGDEIWVVSRLSEKQGPSAQVITDISDQVTVTLPRIAEVDYVIGKPFSGLEAGPVQFIDSLEAIQEGLNSGEQVWPKP